MKKCIIKNKNVYQLTKNHKKCQINQLYGDIKTVQLDSCNRCTLTVFISALFSLQLLHSLSSKLN